MVGADDASTPRKAKKGKSVLTQPEKIVTLHQERRSAFYKLGYNENHIPNQKGYEKVKKQKLD